ncbi:hypothetical protein NGRA_0833 [Nosema granulosis]|uniref:Uncharacterized protein n=1 Tax=Nosema granulosis TaxID=83296 RepID=A0A9P6H0M4_9MICR|nr:hypothetical protein NGRA_0833 [Nosema granulosis]
MLILNIVFVFSNIVIDSLSGKKKADEIIVGSFYHRVLSYISKEKDDIVIVNKKQKDKNMQLFIHVDVDYIYFYYKNAQKDDKVLKYTEYGEITVLINTEIGDDQLNIFVSIDKNVVGTNPVAYYNQLGIELKENQTIKYLSFDTNFYIKKKQMKYNEEDVYLRYEKGDYEMIVYFNNDFSTEMQDFILKKINLNEQKRIDELISSRENKSSEIDKLDASILLMLYSAKESKKLDSKIALLVLNHLFNKVNGEEKLIKIINSLSQSDTKNLLKEYKKFNNGTYTPESLLKTVKMNLNQVNNLSIQFLQVQFLRFDELVDISTEKNLSNQTKKELIEQINRDKKQEIKETYKKKTGEFVKNVEKGMGSYDKKLREVISQPLNNEIEYVKNGSQYSKNVVPLSFSKDFNEMNKDAVAKLKKTRSQGNR